MATICYVNDKKRDAFYYVRQDLEMDEITFVQAAHVFQATASERAKPLHDLHHDQIIAALGSFRGDQMVQALGDRAVATLSPNEKKAHETLAAYGKFPGVTDDEREMMRLAQQAIRVGRFQKLPRAVNKVVPSAKVRSDKPMEKLRELVKVLQTFPLVDKVDEFVVAEPEQDYAKKRDPRHKPPKLENMPQVIISESFIG